jgi:hypothetical protein
VGGDSISHCEWCLGGYSAKESPAGGVRKLRYNKGLPRLCSSSLEVDERAVSMAKGDKVLSSGEVAQICHVAPRTAQKWIDAGLLKGYRIPGSRDRRVPIDEMVRFMEHHGMPVPPELRKRQKD